MATIEKYAAPESLEEAVRLVAGGDATLLAGGTDLMPRMRAGLADLRPVLVNTRGIPELRGVSADGRTIRIGALATVTEILESDILRKQAKILVETADSFAGGQIRNTATIGGNIVNASPAGDMIIPLILLDAEVDLASAEGNAVAERADPIADFFTGPGETVMRPNEILTAVKFKAPGDGFIARFEKFGSRPSMDISIVSVGIAGIKSGGALKSARVAFGAVAPVPLRGRSTEAAVEGKILDAETVAVAALTAAGEVSPISDVRASAWYRTELVRTLTERLLRDVGKT